MGEAYLERVDEREDGWRGGEGKGEVVGSVDLCYWRDRYPSHTKKKKDNEWRAWLYSPAVSPNTGVSRGFPVVAFLVERIERSRLEKEVGRGIPRNCTNGKGRVWFWRRLNFATFGRRIPPHNHQKPPRGRPVLFSFCVVLLTGRNHNPFTRGVIGR